MKIKKKRKKRVNRPAPQAIPAQEQGTRTGPQYRRAEEVIAVDTIPYLFWREWLRARERNDHPLLHELSEPGESLRQSYGTLEEFEESARRNRSSVPGLMVEDLWRIVLDGADEAGVIASYGHKDRTQSTYLAELWSIRRVENKGWRLYSIKQKSISRDKLPKELRPEDFQTD